MKMTNQKESIYISKSYIDIDTDQLEAELNKIKEIKKKLDDVFQSIQKDTNELNDYWDSKTSKKVQDDFIEFYKKVEKTKNNIASDIAFLENTVMAKHDKEMERENTIIDERIAVG